MKKLSLLIFVFMTTIFLVSCSVNVTIDGDASVSIKEGDTFLLDLTTTDEDGLTFSSSDEDVVTVDEDGQITGISVGDATITVTSKSNPEITFEVTVEVTKKVLLSSETTQIVVTVGMQTTIDFESNDDVTFASSSEALFTVSNEGVITGVGEGTGQVTITSVTDPEVKITIGVTVRKVVSVEVTDYPQEMIVGESGTLTVSSSEDVTYESSDETVLTVDETGAITPVGAGVATITVRSSYDESVTATVNVEVYLPIESVTLEDLGKVNVYGDTQLSATILPANGYPHLTYTSSDDTILTIDSEGIVTPIKDGSVTITATSTMNETVTHTITVEVINQILVNQTVTSGTLNVEGMTYTFGVDLFNSLTAALEEALPYAKVIVQEGTYTTDLIINKEGISFMGEANAKIVGDITLAANHIHLSGLSFMGDSSITSSTVLEGIEITMISALDIASDFINIHGVKNGITVSNNTITNVNGVAINIASYESGIILISKNIITDANTAISVKPAETYELTTEIKVERNEITDVIDGIVIETGGDIHAYARFNSVTLASGFLARSNAGSDVEFTLNHWGLETLDLNKFESIEEVMLQGYYVLKTDIISELNYNPLLPVKFIITNPITEILIGETYKLEYEILPYDLETTYVRWITSNPEISVISTDGTFTPVKSGDVTFTVRSTQKTSINMPITITVTTYPGIEITPTNVENNNLVGSTLTLEATPFPVSIQDADVTFVSSDETIATVDGTGIVSLHQAGVVTITAKLVDDPSVTTAYTFEVYNALNENNLMDLLTMSMVTYTTPHRWTAVGVGFNYNDFKYESVSKYYFGDYEVNQSKMVPVSSGIRPGLPMDPHPEGVTQYNEDNVYWVVIHDTANTNPGSGALAHANYLLSNAMNGTELWASWHFTIDDKALYQHIPENERAYHAGDGSSLPGTSPTYLGGGNRNGIGIETGVNQDADVYRIWQRTAKFGTALLNKYNLPLANMRYHVDFSGKNCPQTMRNAGLVPLFEEMKWYEYTIGKNFSDAEIEFVSNNPEYVDHTGRVIQMPDRAMTVSYTVTVTLGTETVARTFYSYLPGTVK